MEDDIPPKERDLLVTYWSAGDHIGIITHPGLRRQHHNHWWGIKVNDHQRTIVGPQPPEIFWSDGNVNDNMK